eukprot:COSAG05_NODE_1793_length_4082_cov_2.602310_3_plen_105_part_00
MPDSPWLGPEPEPEPEPGLGPGLETETEPAPEPAPVPHAETEPAAGCGVAATRGLGTGLVVVTYNILAQSYFDHNQRQRGACPAQYRSQAARHAMLVRVLRILS